MQRNRVVKGLLGGLLVAAMLLGVLPALVLPAATRAATTWYVDDSGGADYTTIQAAVTAATAGDTIIVRDGAYVENVIVDKSLVVRSENGAAAVTVTAVTTSSPVFTVNASSVTIDGFTVSGTTSTSVGGIEVKNVGSCLIAGNDVTGCGVGIRLAGTATNNAVTGNNCHGNTKYGFAIRDSASGNFVSRNTLSANTSKDICIKDSSANNTLWLNDVLSSGVEILTTVVGQSPSPVTYTYNGGTYTGYLGNYYSTYSGVDADGNGIGDTAFTYGATYTDSYPLMAQHTGYAEMVLHTITASAGANGSISPSGAVSVNEGDSQSFTIAADTGYVIADVLVDGSSVGAQSSYTFSDVLADHTIAASFDVAPSLYFATPWAKPGVAFGMNLYDFAPNASGVAWFDNDGDGIRDAEEPQSPVTVNAAGSGNPSPALSTPADAVPGIYTVYADVPEGGAVEASADFTVTGIVLNPTSGPAGTSIGVTGYHWPGRSGYVWFDSDGDSVRDDGEPQAAVATDAGDVGMPLSPASITVPEVAGGDYQVLADIPVGGFAVDHSATFTVTSVVPDWDLNGDGVCNIGDVVVIGLKWGETGTPGWIPEDLNGDGEINIGDVVVIGLHWGEAT